MFDWINGITADATTAFRAVVFLAAAVIFFVVAAKVRFAMATTIITGIACGLAMFLVMQHTDIGQKVLMRQYGVETPPAP